MSTQGQLETAKIAAPSRPWLAGLRLILRNIRRAIASQFSSSLTRRIVFLNMSGLIVLVIGFLLLNQFRADIIEARVQSLRTQAGIIAAAVAAASRVDVDAITINPEDLLSTATATPTRPFASEDSAIEFSINPERVGPMLHRLVTPTRTWARIYDRDGLLLLDSRSLQFRSVVARQEALDATRDNLGLFEKFWRFVASPFASRKRVAADDAALSDGKALPEIVAALAGHAQSTVRANSYGETIVSVAAPIQRASTISGALLLSTPGNEIDAVIASERWALLRFFLVLSVVMLLLSLSLANTIAAPVRKLAAAAERVRRGVKSRQQIPDFTARHDEIGHLSQTLRDMTQALYTRMDAIESFAADVAHELKNPLTSLRSAVEVLPRVKAGPSHDRLLEVIQHDVRRLDRLISDISDASRLDAELARDDAGPVDMAALIRAVMGIFADSPRGNGCTLRLDCNPEAKPRYIALGHDSRLAQVMTNLIDNACSFSEPGGQVRINLQRVAAPPGGFPNFSSERIIVTVEDDGPGIPTHALESVFERFYTDRPSHGFGQNSGLGLSISRQIVEAHGGVISAANRPALDEHKAVDGLVSHSGGARFTISLPASPE